MILEAPESGSWIAFVDVEVKDADVAVAEAWRICRGDVQLELRSMTPVANHFGWEDGRSYISEAALKARWALQIATGPNSWYGMGLDTDMSGGMPKLYHGGRLYGQRSDIIWWPEHRVGLVTLMNSSNGDILMEAFPRKVTELLFDERSEADSMVAAAAVADPI